MTTNDGKPRHALFRKVVLGVFWFAVMWIGLHTCTAFYIGLRAGLHSANPQMAGPAGAHAADVFADRYGPVMVGIAFTLTMMGLKNGFFLSKKLRPAGNAPVKKKNKSVVKSKTDT
jgi:hypothetical protein